ncbi:thyroid transcription factor 1-associated protein 26 homolog [Nylanderia fulva]|uniref:thyroid transcription factor 1-associated protein 26 homolog n=1 Tax=Nylanderia fulva TaxID=613905 RepID=UPI0010FB78E6|nr:thyroid transcription factor 1-associated protein 26 homolog [Nylanderia fulva]
MKNIKNKKPAKEGDDKKEKVEKKFDKKKYRLQKYSNKYKIDQWEEKRKKAVLRGFYKELAKDQQNSQSSSLNKPKNTNEISNSKSKSYAFYKAKQEYKRKQEDKKRRIEDAIRVKAEREEALRKYKEKKLQNFRVLSRKTRKGQPVMKGRIEMLLEKIQQSVK